MTSYITHSNLLCYHCRLRFKYTSQFLILCQLLDSDHGSYVCMGSLELSSGKRNIQKNNNSSFQFLLRSPIHCGISYFLFDVFGIVNAALNYVPNY